jgi:hypothetical protein
MALQKFDRSKWMDVCAAASVEMLGKRAEIEVVSPIDGILIEANWLPVLGIAYDSVSDALKIQPRELYFDFGLGGVQSLGILDRENAWQIVLLRDPPMLPRPAEIT